MLQYINQLTEGRNKHRLKSKKRGAFCKHLCPMWKCSIIGWRMGFEEGRKSILSTVTVSVHFLYPFKVRAKWYRKHCPHSEISWWRCLWRNAFHFGLYHIVENLRAAKALCSFQEVFSVGTRNRRVIICCQAPPSYWWLSQAYSSWGLVVETFLARTEQSRSHNPAWM